MLRAYAAAVHFSWDLGRSDALGHEVARAALRLEAVNALRNVQVIFIQKELVITNNTTKTHVHCICQKLGRSSHQEPNNLVDARKRELIFYQNHNVFGKFKV